MALAVAECSALLRSGYRGPVFKRLRDEYFNQTARSRAAGSIFCIRRAPSALRCVIGNALIAAPLCACAFWLNHCGLQEFNGVHTTAGGGGGVGAHPRPHPRLSGSWQPRCLKSTPRVRAFAQFNGSKVSLRYRRHVPRNLRESHKERTKWVFDCLIWKICIRKQAILDQLFSPSWKICSRSSHLLN